MPTRLRKEEIVTLQVLSEKGESHCQVAQVLGVTEGAVRYHLRRAEEGAVDGRRDKPFKAEAIAEHIAAWYEREKESRRPVNVRDLYEHLLSEHEYAGSYKSVVRYVRARYGRPQIRTYRRVETPAGAQSQTDWGEYPGVDVGQGPEPLHAFVMVLSHSRKPAVVWSRSEDQLHWLWAHNEAYRRLRGVAAVNRIDNVKTAIAAGAGAWGTIHETYRAYARAVGFHIDACSPGESQAKGKVEAKVRLSRLRVDASTRAFDALEDLQEWTDKRLESWSKRAICPATGKSVEASWEAELEHMPPLPILPEPFDVVVTRPVHRDCMVLFENHSYAVPFGYADQQVEVRGCADKVQILAAGRVVREYPRRTPHLVLVDPSCYEGPATDRVLPPPPLGKMGRRLQELWAMPVERRPLDLYAALAEVAR
jgi:transposase